MKTIEEKAKAYDFAIEKAKELMKKGYDVLMPELFPELAISEDERIRKEIVSLVLKILGQEKDNLSDKKYDSMLHWLERQKEQKSITIPERIRPKFSVGDTVCRKGYADHTVIEIYLCKDPVYICKNDEGLESHILFSEQDEWELVKEQKPNPLYGTTDEYYREAYYADSKKSENYDHEMWKNCEANFEGGKKEVVNNPEKYGLCKKQEWSEEDEEVIKLIESSTWDGEKLTQGEAGVVHRWLKDLPNRFSLRPQPKDEWSEEDEECRQELIQYIEQRIGDGTTGQSLWNKWHRWLKDIPNRISLRPHWKPTKDQLESIRYLLEDYSPWLISSADARKDLRDVYEQLKKL